MDTTYLMKRYAVVTLLTMIAVMIIGYLVEMFFNHDIGSVGGMIAVFVPAMDAGQTYVRRGHGKPANGFAWKMSVIFLIVNGAIGLVFMAALMLILGGGGELFGILSGLGVAVLSIITAVVFIGMLLATRFFFGFGAKNELKMQEKRAAEKQP
ncbi:ABZJ_00895 family protein [Litoreibacter albidus]|uniref:ABZJ_00895 family protein n=1 Tax=Litoreibacter albidus TaxID=670155 RepID=UPI003734CC14